MNREAEVVNMYQSGKMLREIARDVFGVQSIEKTLSILKRHPESGYEPGRRTTRRCKYFFDETFFETIDTQEKAYFFGFMAADGYIKKTNNNPMGIGLELKSDDIEIVEKFRDALGEKNVPVIVRTPKNSCEKAKVVFFSRKLANDLFDKFGDDKTHNLGAISKYVPVELHNHFVRGVIDGDGSWVHEKYRLVLSIRGTYDFLEDIQDIIPEKATLFTGNQKWPSLATRNQRASARMFYWLYDNATVYLERKFIKSKSGLSKRLLKEKSRISVKVRKRVTPRHSLLTEEGCNDYQETSL